MIRFDEEDLPKKVAARDESPGSAEAKRDTEDVALPERTYVWAPSRRPSALSRSEPRSRAPMVATGAAVVLGLVAAVSVLYAESRSAAVPDVTAYCVDQFDVLADDELVCDEEYVRSQGGYSYSGGTFFLPNASGFGSVQYHYSYGGTIGPNRRVSGGSIVAPADAEVRTPSGRSIQRGGFGSSSGGKSGGS